MTFMRGRSCPACNERTKHEHFVNYESEQKVCICAHALLGRHQNACISACSHDDVGRAECL